MRVYVRACVRVNIIIINCREFRGLLFYFTEYPLVRLNNKEELSFNKIIWLQ